MKCPLFSLLCISTLISLSNPVQAQLKIPGTGAFRSEMLKVVADFPQGFAAIRGGEIDKTPQSVEYASRIAIDGSKETSIHRYSSNGKAIYSFQSVLLRTEEFAAAAAKYKWAFQQLKGMTVRYVVDQYTLEGRLDAPDESRSFAASDLTLKDAPDALQKLRIRVQLQYELSEWKVSLLVFEKEREDKEQGSGADE